MGSQLAATLEMNGAVVRCYDIGHPFSEPALNARDTQTEVLLGCTGRRTAFHSDWCRPGRRYLLINCASTDTEFCARVLRPVGVRTASPLVLVHDPLDPTPPWRTSYTIRVRDEAALRLSRGGFPVNFSNDRDAVPPELFSHVRRLVLEAGMRAMDPTGIYA